VGGSPEWAFAAIPQEADVTTGARCPSPVRSRPDRGPEPTDAELIAAVRAGTRGGAAYARLYARHAGPARRLAAVLARDRADAEDLVAEAFTKVLATLRAGRGPDTAFRAYLLTTLRHACYDRAQWERRVELTADLTRYERRPADGGHGGADGLASLERSYAVRAFRRLPERWRRVLWHTEVDGEKPAQIAPRLGLSANAVAALAYRARERLRQMYLQEHLTAAGTPACHWTTDRLGAHVRRGLARRDRTRVERHLSGCAECRSRCAEVAVVNTYCGGGAPAQRPRLAAGPAGVPGEVVSAACG
jgi:RNA polymerase sigma factor (sigma-70 family)